MGLITDEWAQIAAWLGAEQTKGRIAKPIAYLLKDPQSIIHDILAQGTLFDLNSKKGKSKNPDYEMYVTPEVMAELAREEK